MKNSQVLAPEKSQLEQLLEIDIAIAIPNSYDRDLILDRIDRKCQLFLIIDNPWLDNSQENNRWLDLKISDTAKNLVEILMYIDDLGIEIIL
jgi:hypothetical protein